MRKAVSTALTSETVVNPTDPHLTTHEELFGINTVLKSSAQTGQLLMDFQIESVTFGCLCHMCMPKVTVKGGHEAEQRESDSFRAGTGHIPRTNNINYRHSRNSKVRNTR